MSSISGPIDPTDLANVSPPLDQTVSGVSPTTALVELRGDNGLLLPCARNPKEASAGAVTFVGITSLDGDHGATYAGGSVVISTSAPTIGQSMVIATPAANEGGTAAANITPTATGRFLIAVGYSIDGDTSWSIADTATHTWNTATAARRDNGAARHIQAWWTFANTASQITVTLTGTAWYNKALVLIEADGISQSTPFDNGVGADVIGADPVTSGTMSTAQAVELLIGLSITAAGNTTVYTQGSGWTILGQQNTPGGPETLAAQYQITSSQGSYESTWSISPTRNTTHLMVAFRA